MTTPLGHHLHSTEKPAYEKWLAWAKSHQEILFISGIVVLLLGGGIPYYLHSQEKADQDAQGVLSLAQYYMHAQVDPKNGPFKTEADKETQVLQTFQHILTDFAGTPTAKLARFYVAKGEYQMNKPQDAYNNFEIACSELKDTPLGEEAQLGKIICLEAQNKMDQAIVL